MNERLVTFNVLRYGSVVLMVGGLLALGWGISESNGLAGMAGLFCWTWGDNISKRLARQ